METISKLNARQFILAKQGLIGAYRFIGKSGAYDYVRQAGCIQLETGYPLGFYCFLDLTFIPIIVAMRTIGNTHAISIPLFKSSFFN